VSPASDAWPLTFPCPRSLALVRSFVPLVRLVGPRLELLRPLLTSRSRFPRRPLRHEARSPQVRTYSFTAQPPDLRHHALIQESFAVFGPLALLCSAFYPLLAYRHACLRSKLPSHTRSPSCSCASLRLLRSIRDGTCTRRSAPILGAPKKTPNQRLGVSL